MRTLTLPLLLLAPAIAFAAPWVYDSTAQTLTRGTVVLQNVVADGTSLTIKDNKSNATAVDVDLSEGVADGYAVVKIDDAAFNGNSSITNVVFPDTLVTIGNGAFRSCANLACSVSLPSSLAGSLSRTFRESPVTGDIVVPNGVTAMQETFCKAKITSLVCGIGLTAVQGGDGLCQSCTTLTNVVFQSGCSLGQNEFYGCTALERVTLHPDMSGAWIQTFKNCSSLTGDIVLPRGVTGMKETFMNAKITSFETVSTNLVYIGYQTNGDGDFSNCRTLTNIVLHAGLKTIGTRVFNNCTGLTEIVLPDTVETFTASFNSCSSLKRVVMPKNLATIGSRTFKGQPMEIYWSGYPKNGFTFGGTDTHDPMWDVYTANVVTNWIRLEDKASWAAAAATYPDYVQLPPETPRGATGWWKGGYRSSAKTILRWWYPPALVVLIK